MYVLLEFLLYFLYNLLFVTVVIFSVVLRCLLSLLLVSFLSFFIAVMTVMIYPTLTTSSTYSEVQEEGSSIRGYATEEDVHIIPEDCRYDTIKHQLNACYELKNSSLLDAFYEVDHRKDTSAHYLYVLFYFTFISLPVSIATMFVDIANADKPYPFARKVTSSTCFFALVAMLCIGYMSYLRPKWLFRHISPKLQFRLNAFMVIAIQYAFLIVFIRRVFDFNCQLEFPDELKSMAGGICYSNALEKDQVLAINSLSLFIVPVLAYTSLKNVPITVVWSVMTICIIIVLISAVALRAIRAIPIVLIWGFMGFFFIRDYHLKNILIFLTNRQLKHQIIENKRISDETHATEMRHLIANVAHDLKTVSIIFFHSSIPVNVVKYDSLYCFIDSL